MIRQRRNAFASWVVLSVALCFPGIPASAVSDEDRDQIAYQVRGSGEPVVLLHGFSQTREMWDDIGVVSALAKEFRVLSVDLRGHGNSTKPHRPEDYGPKMAEDVVRLLDHLGIEKAHIVGFSMGATIAGSLVISHPERFRTATLGSGLFPSWNEEEEAYAEYTEDRAITGETFPWEPPNQDYVALAAAIRGFRYFDVTEADIAAIQAPIAIIVGSLELAAFTAEERRIWNNLPNSFRKVVVDGADHDQHRPAIREPEFLEAVLDLINGYGK